MNLARIGGTRIAVHPGMLALVAAALWAGMAGEVAVFFAVLAGHELAHVLAAAAFDLRIAEVELLPFGGVARIEGLELADPGVEASVAVAGPLHNLLCVAAAFVLRQAGWLNPHRGEFFLAANAALALGNLLPALPLDGGRVVRAALAVRSGAGPATAWVARAGYWVAGGLAALGALLLLRGVLAPGLFVFAFFTFSRARPEGEAAWMRPWREFSRRTAGIAQYGALPVQPLAVDAEAPLRDVVARFLPRRYHLVWLIDRGGNARGPWDEAAVWAALRRAGAGARAADLGHPRDPARL